MKESVADYLRLMKIPRYRRVREEKNYRKACGLLYECGYATDPKYGEKLIGIIEKYGLFRWDSPHSDRGICQFEGARAFVKEKGISDGKRPKAFATREEVWEMMRRAMD